MLQINHSATAHDRESGGTTGQYLNSAGVHHGVARGAAQVERLNAAAAKYGSDRCPRGVNELATTAHAGADGIPAGIHFLETSGGQHSAADLATGVNLLQAAADDVVVGLAT